MGLFDPIWMTNDINKIPKALTKVNSISDNDTLKEIVFKAKLEEIVEAAIARINDENILQDIILNKYSGLQNDMTVLAIKKIKSDMLLYDLLKKVSPSLKEDVALAINDQELLKDIIKNMDSRARRGALKKRINPSYQECLLVDSGYASSKLLEIVEGMKYPEDKEALLEIARLTGYRNAAKEAIEKIPFDKEKDALLKLLKEAKTDATKEFVMKKLPLENHQMLIEIMKDKNTSLSLKKDAAKVLSKNKEYASLKVCPYCGSLGSVEKFSGEYVSSADMYYQGYRCKVCGHEDSLPVGMQGAKDFSISLEEYK